MVEVMCLGRGQEGEVIAAVRHAGGQKGDGEPHPSGCNVRAQEDGPQHWGQQVTQHMLHGVGVDGCHANGGCPLMVHLVDALVKIGLVKQSG